MPCMVGLLPEDLLFRQQELRVWKRSREEERAAPISLLFNDVRLSRPQLSGASTAPGRAISLLAAAAALAQAPAHRGARL